MTITVHQRPLEETRSANKSCKWLGEAIVNGRTYTATSRNAPANDIARQLVADLAPDGPMQVYTAGLKGCLVWRSFYRAAGYTFEENDRSPVKRRRPRLSQDEQGVPTGPKQGVNAPAAPEASPPLKGRAQRLGFGSINRRGNDRGLHPYHHQSRIPRRNRGIGRPDLIDDERTTRTALAALQVGTAVRRRPL
jgi:hypothetical protein